MEVTTGGKMIKERLRGIVGCRTKNVEGVGKKVKDLLSNTDPWAGHPCGRQESLSCQPDGEREQNCRRRNIIYESKCNECNPGARRDDEQSSRK